MRSPGRPHTNWGSAVNKDSLRMGITCEEAEVAAHNRSEGQGQVILLRNTTPLWATCITTYMYAATECGHWIRQQWISHNVGD